MPGYAAKKIVANLSHFLSYSAFLSTYTNGFNFGLFTFLLIHKFVNFLFTQFFLSFRFFQNGGKMEIYRH